jgi:predicted nucleic acid-binding protein
LIVADASAVLELLLLTPRSARLQDLMLAPGERLHAPHLLDVEVTQALRRLLLAGELTEVRAAQALADFALLVIERHAHGELIRRAWKLKDAMTAYDGVYVALAEALDASLLTCDARLARSHGHRAEIQLVS